MPISAELFDLLFRQRMEGAMSSAHTFLTAHQGWAYSIEELSTELRLPSDLLADVLEELEFRKAAESRCKDGILYYRRSGDLVL